MRQLAVEAKWNSAADTTLSVATSLYSNLPAGTPLWNSPGEIVTAATTELIEILGSDQST